MTIASVTRTSYLNGTIANAVDVNSNEDAIVIGVNSAINDLNAATDAKTPNALVRRDSSGNFVGIAPQITSGNYASLDAAVADIGSSVQTLVITDANFPMLADVTIPTTLTIQIDAAGSILLASTKTLTFSGAPVAGLYQIFTGSGAVAGLTEAYPEWFGTLSSTSINSAITALATGGTVNITSSATLSSTVNVNKSCVVKIGPSVTLSSPSDASHTPGWYITANNVSMIGESSTSSTLVCTESGARTNKQAALIKINAGVTDVSFFGLGLVGSGRTYNPADGDTRLYGTVILAQGTSGSYTERISVSNCKVSDGLNSIVLYYSKYSRVENCSFRNTQTDGSYGGGIAVNLWSNTGTVIDGNTYEDTSTKSVNFVEATQGADTPNEACIISNNTVKGTTYEGINFRGLRCICTGNTVYGAALTGIDLTCLATSDTTNQVSQNIVSNNTVYTTGSSQGIGLDDQGYTFGIKNNIVTGNQIYVNGSGTGILVTGTNSTGNQIINNRIVFGTSASGTTGDGIYTSAPETYISGNIISTARRCGVYINGNISKVTVTENTIYSCLDAGIQTSGTQDRITVTGNNVYSNASGFYIASSYVTNLTVYGNAVYSNTSFQYGSFPASTTILKTDINNKNTTANRFVPTADNIGQLYLDTTLNANGQPIFWQGTKWVTSTGANA